MAVIGAGLVARAVMGNQAIGATFRQQGYQISANRYREYWADSLALLAVKRRSGFCGVHGLRNENCLWLLTGGAGSFLLLAAAFATSTLLGTFPPSTLLLLLRVGEQVGLPVTVTTYLFAKMECPFEDENCWVCRQKDGRSRFNFRPLNPIITTSNNQGTAA